MRASYTKTPATEYSARKEKSRKKYLLEDPHSDPNSSDSPSSNYYSSDDRKYKHRRRENRKKYWKLKK